MRTPFNNLTFLVLKCPMHGKDYMVKLHTEKEGHMFCAMKKSFYILSPNYSSIRRNITKEEMVKAIGEANVAALLERAAKKEDEDDVPF